MKFPVAIPRFCCWLVLGHVFGVGVTSHRAFADDEIQNDQVRQSIRGDWYERKTDTYAPPSFRELRDHPVRQNGRLAGPDWNWGRPNWNVGWIFGMLSYVFSTVLVILLLTCLILLLMYFSRGARLPEQPKTSQKIQIDLARVEDLPFSVEEIEGDPLRQARRLADAGRFDFAIIFLYGYILLALDQSRRIHLQKGKTNRTYLRELGAAQGLARIVESTMLKFEQVYFGKYPLSKENFEESWLDLDEFHRSLQSGHAASEDFKAPSVAAEAFS